MSIALLTCCVFKASTGGLLYFSLLQTDFHCTLLHFFLMTPLINAQSGSLDDCLILLFHGVGFTGAKQQLLHKLRRFEKLAELDPIELEKRMLEGLDDDNNDAAQWDAESEDCVDDDESIASDREKKVDDFVREVLNKSRFHHFQGIPQDMKRLVSDLIAQEEREQQCSRSREVVVERVCKRLESWTEVESNTIDMMVELDFRRELSGWSKNQEQVDEAAIEIELAIFGLLVEEVSEELVCLKGI